MMTTTEPMSAEQLAREISRRRLESDLRAAPIQVGVARGQWDIVRADFPVVVIRVSAAEVTYAPGWLWLRFDLTGYPDDAPTACPWDPTTETKLGAKRPGGRRATYVFRANWENGEAVYIPCDRRAWLNHEAQWSEPHKDLLWEPAVGIVKYLTVVHTILTEDAHA
jgi:hypothetical protein